MLTLNNALKIYNNKISLNFQTDTNKQEQFPRSHRKTISIINFRLWTKEGLQENLSHRLLASPEEKLQKFRNINKPAAAFGNSYSKENSRVI